MTEQKLMEYCQSKLGAVLEYPFDPVTAVFKTGDKIFALIYEDSGIVKISLKCEPMLAEFLRQQYQSVTPGWHLNKTHWNTVLCDGGIPDDEIFRQIYHSHELIMKSLTKKKREQLKIESHPLYLFPSPCYQPLEPREGDEYFPQGYFTFNITRLLEHIAAHRGEYALGEIRVEDYMTSFNKITPEQCTDADLTNPLILAEISPRNYSVIDGNHRLAKAHYDGVKTLQAYMLSSWQHSLFIKEQRAYDAYIEYWNGKLEYE